MHSIFPVIVLYKTSLQESQSYQSLLRPNGIDDFLVYDNSPADYDSDLSQIPAGASYIRDTANSGLPKAYNEAARMAQAKGCSHLLLLDQDTDFPEQMWQAYQANLPFAGIVAPILRTNQGRNFSPVYIAGLSPQALPVIPGDYSLFAYAPVNSGCCIPVRPYLEAGGYDEALRLDFADYQFQARFRKICPAVRFLSMVGVQDFSNDCMDFSKVLQRFSLYLEGARYCHFDTWSQVLKHQYGVAKHALALSLKMSSPRFLSLYLTQFLFN